MGNAPDFAETCLVCKAGANSKGTPLAILAWVAPPGFMNFRSKILILPFRPQDMICRRRQQLERRKDTGVRSTRVLREPVSAREEARRRRILQGKSYIVSSLVAAR